MPIVIVAEDEEELAAMFHEERRQHARAQGLPSRAVALLPWGEVPAQFRGVLLKTVRALSVAVEPGAPIPPAPPRVT